MNTNMTGLDGFQKSLSPCALDKSSHSIGMVNHKISRNSPPKYVVSSCFTLKLFIKVSYPDDIVKVSRHEWVNSYKERVTWQV